MRVELNYGKGSLPDGYRRFPVLQKPFKGSELGETLARLLRPKEPNV